MSDCDHSVPQLPEMDAAVARQAMKEGDLSHAAHHVAAALSHHPDRDDLIALLEELVDRAGGPEAALDLFPIAGGTWFGQAAVHAWLLHACGRRSAALDLLLQVIVARPDVPYLGWLGAWLEADDLDPVDVHGSLSRLLQLEQPPEGALDVLAGLRARFPEQGPLWSLSSMLTRRAGRLEEALALARETAERFPSWTSSVALANAYRALGRWDDTVAAWEDALRHDPDDLGVRLDWSDALLERWDLDEAARRYGEVEARQPGHPWAHPSRLYVAWAQAPTVANRRALHAWADAHPDSDRARDLSERATPWLGRLPSPGEATLSSLAQVVDALKGRDTGGSLTLTLSCLESASSQWFARRTLDAYGATLAFVVQAVPTPDPRAPRFDAAHTPWVWEGTDARVALPEPGPQTRAAVRALADSRYHAPTWLGAAPSVLAQAGVAPEAAAELLAAALHPSPAPTWTTPWEWAWRTIHAAAFLLAGQPGWAGTAHREALMSMLAVRNDWLTVAAAAAAAERARADDAVRPEVREALLSILRDGPDQGYWCAGWPVTAALLRAGTDDAPDLEIVLWDHLSGFEDPDG